MKGEWKRDLSNKIFFKKKELHGFYIRGEDLSPLKWFWFAKFSFKIIVVKVTFKEWSLRFFKKSYFKWKQVFLGTEMYWHELISWPYGL